MLYGAMVLWCYGVLLWLCPIPYADFGYDLSLYIFLGMVDGLKLQLNVDVVAFLAFLWILVLSICCYRTVFATVCREVVSREYYERLLERYLLVDSHSVKQRKQRKKQALDDKASFSSSSSDVGLVSVL